MANTEHGRDLEDDPGWQEWRAAKERAYRERPVKSDVRDPAGRYWCALLDGRPVAHCTAFDTEAGWVQVYIVARSRQSSHALRTLTQVRLSGHVEAIWIDQFQELMRRLPPVEVMALDEEDGKH